MATLGKGDMKIKNLRAPGGWGPAVAPALVAGLNLIVQPTQIQPVAVSSISAPVIGAPIMREDFVTETGFLIGADIG